MHKEPIVTSKKQAYQNVLHIQSIIVICKQQKKYYITLRFASDIPLILLFASSKEVLKLSDVIEESNVI